MRKDRFDQEICVDDYIIYPVKHSYTAAINFARVLELVPYENYRRVYTGPTWKDYTIEQYTDYKIKCRKLDTGKVVVINNRNEIRINASVLPEEYK